MSQYSPSLQRRDHQITKTRIKTRAYRDLLGASIRQHSFCLEKILSPRILTLIFTSIFILSRCSLRLRSRVLTKYHPILRSTVLLCHITQQAAGMELLSSFPPIGPHLASSSSTICLPGFFLRQFSIPHTHPRGT